MKDTPSPTIAASRVLCALGNGVKAARLRRRMPAADLAMRIDVSLPTLRKLERGDPSVSLGSFVSALSSMGFGDALLEAMRVANGAFEAETDESARLPSRIRRSKSEINLDDL